MRSSFSSSHQQYNERVDWRQDNSPVPNAKGIEAEAIGMTGDVLLAAASPMRPSCTKLESPSNPFPQIQSPVVGFQERDFYNPATSSSSTTLSHTPYTPRTPHTPHSESNSVHDNLDQCHRSVDSISPHRNGRDSVSHLLGEFENGYFINVFDGKSHEQKRTLLQLSNQRNCLRLLPETNFQLSEHWCVDEKKTDTPRTSELNSNNAPCDLEWNIPLSSILQIDVGKKTSRILSDLHDLDPLVCFSVSFMDANESMPMELGLVAQSPVEREMIVSALLIVLDYAVFEEIGVAPPPMMPEQDAVPSETEDDGTLEIPSLSAVAASPAAPSRVLSPRPSESAAAFLDSQQMPLPHSRLGNSERRLQRGAGSSSSMGVPALKSQRTTPFPSDLVANDNALQAEMLINDNSSSVCQHFCAFLLMDFANACGFSRNEEAEEKQCNPVEQLLLGETSVTTTATNLCTNLEVVQTYITSFLGDSVPSFPDLNSAEWFEGQIWSAETSVRGKDEQESETTKLRNRASVLNAQALRFRRLRDEMTFRAAVNQSRKKMHQIQTTQSMEDFECPVEAAKVDRVSLGHGNYSGLSHVPDNAAEPVNSSVDIVQQSALLTALFGGDAPEKEKEEEVLYYDSDPGEVKPRRPRRGSRLSLVDNSVHNIQDKERTGLNSQVDEEGAKEQDREKGETKSNLHVSEFADECFLDSFSKMHTLVWHPTQSEDNSNRSPICVNVWVERGSHVQSSYIQPKLMWKPVQETKLERRRLSITDSKPEAIDLLDMCRILVPKKIDRYLHPYAKLSCSFEIETPDDVFLFEAESSAVRDEFVQGLKLVVARLASCLIVGDHSVYREYFTPFSSRVPGKAPEWIQGGSTAEDVDIMSDDDLEGLQIIL